MRPTLLAALLLGLVGCAKEPEISTVTGQLLLNGKPLANILITFIPERSGANSAVRSMGITDAEGKFKLQTEAQTPGALLGPHKVILEDMAIHNAPRSENGTVLELPPPRFPDRYKSILHSPLKAEITPGANNLKLEIQPQ